MKKERWLAGWMRIEEGEFKEMAGEALIKDPSLRAQLKQALVASAGMSHVPGEVLSRCLRWIDEIQIE